MRLEQALYEVHPKIFAEIAETVAGDEPIAVGTWTFVGVSVKCGCLAANGYVGSHGPLPWGGHDNRETLDMLLRWYGVASSVVSRRKLAEVARAFDEWCLERRLGGYITHNDEARRELRELVAGVAAERKAWTS